VWCFIEANASQHHQIRPYSPAVHGKKALSRMRITQIGLRTASSSVLLFNYPDDELKKDDASSRSEFSSMRFLDNSAFSSTPSHPRNSAIVRITDK
jgi:hypothetical protein